MTDEGSDGSDRTAAKPEGAAAADLRRRRADVSKQAIRDAVATLLRTEHPATLSIPAVAAEAGVSVRTVYRYFPTKQDLLDDVAEVQSRRADAIMEGRGGLFENPGEYLVALWSDFENDLEAVRAQHLSPLGSAIRARRMERFRADLRVRIDERHPETSDQDRADLTDLIMMVLSSSAFLDLHTRLGRSGPEAARLAWWAARAMQKQFATDGGIRARPPLVERQDTHDER